jgi:hypothetical protein
MTEKIHKTIFCKDFEITKTDFDFDYQKDLTVKLDNQSTAFDENAINEIVLWKVNRYVKIEKETLKLVNNIKTDSKELDIENTKIVLKALLQTKGIQLPMASTILRFKNPKIYQIIDQRVYRIIYEEKKLKLNTYPSEKNLNEQIELYLIYLIDLNKICDLLQIPFDKSDRILFMADRRINKDISLDNY